MTPSEHAAGRFLPETEFPPDLVEDLLRLPRHRHELFVAPTTGDVTLSAAKREIFPSLTPDGVRPVRLHAQ